MRFSMDIVEQNKSGGQQKGWFGDIGWRGEEEELKCEVNVVDFS